MLQSTISGFLFTAGVVYAQSPFTIFKPSNSEFIKLGSLVDIGIQTNSPSGNIQIQLCTFITGQNLCSNGATVLLRAPSCTVNSTYTVPIASTQTPGLTALIVGTIDTTGALKNTTSIDIMLGSK